ncbi:hypothetical protein SKAU_G00274800 [Synaphobranchus kaupii]|uniref:NID domain-containing protein n=1 Tax=Synaphobranchus kaupii TaxID=118154 RepID=A0A9Q1F117_SYNKA|nr:hypothetical protein SKAU_G00274800 [Synaphobranchus kaupii]
MHKATIVPKQKVVVNPLRVALSPRMSFSEEFSLLSDNDEELLTSPMEVDKMDIEKYKVTHHMTMEDQRDLLKARDQQLDMAEEFKKRSVKLRTTLEAEEQDQARRVEDGKVALSPWMSFSEEFSLLSDNDEELLTSPMEVVKMDIEKYKVTHDMTMEDQRDLLKARDQQLDMAEEFKKRSVKLRKTLEAEEQDQARRVEDGKVRLAAAEEEERKQKEQLVRMEAELSHLEQEMDHLREQDQESIALPEKKMAFQGAMREADCSRFHMKSRILYPMEGGSALITFEDEAVAQNIVRLRQHEVRLGECCISLEARPVEVLMPSHVEVTTHVCPRSILVSEVPKHVEESRLLDKLEIHFFKRQNHGGEVDKVDILHESGNVALTFAEDTVAKGLTDRQYHEVNMPDGKRYRVKVTPFLNGEITDLKTRVSVSARTVLLTGFPAIMDPEDLQDQLEIHFQKGSSGGGDIEAIAYNPLRQRALAIFENDCPAAGQ